MHSRFFNGFLVFLFPDSVFKHTIEEDSAFEPLISLLLFSGILTGLGLKLIQRFAIYKLDLKFSTALLAVFTVFFISVLLTAAISGFSDWIYSFGIKVRKKNVNSDFLSSFCCHAYVMPVWFFLLSVYLFLPNLKRTSLFIIMAVLLAVRLLDIEARLIKAVHGLRLIQSYVFVFLVMVLVVFGASMAYFSKDIIIYLCNS